MSQRSTRVQLHWHRQPGIVGYQQPVRFAQSITGDVRHRHSRRHQQRPVPVRHRVLAGEHYPGGGTALIILWR